ncbi:hypothetical protein H312_00821 [Anncaliia algerae PRA339]|uniref:DNA replication licensing factor MCM3 n=1 Tax=Anncaliia algerae PRA339 TaxID=1288291 RepID=A0A059F483_9MICR|nr:hypothetical protein H312_00821 [Anncaliia algerae PRA339]
MEHSSKISFTDVKPILDLNELRITQPKFVESIINDPLNVLPQHPNKKIIGSLGENIHNPRTLTCKSLSKLIAVEGIVTSVSTVKPKLVKSVHFSEKTKIFYEKEYRDATMISKLPITNTVYPTKDANGPLNTEFGMSTFIDYQNVVIQELVETSPLGQLPRSMEAILSDDLINRVKPGDRVRLIGVYKPLVGMSNEFPKKFKSVLIVNNIEFINLDSAHMKVNIEKINELTFQQLGEKGLEGIVVECEENLQSKKFGEFDIKENASQTEKNNSSTNQNLIQSEHVIREISKRKDILNLVANSIAPSIYGHTNIKRAIALMLVGGNEIIRNNLSKTRGDINILLVGDPGTAKSQLLRYVKSISPLCINTTGRGSTGVGLTAAVVFDKDTGDKRLEAGAMVIADRGIVCIDEFDKMNDDDRVALHEVMEQQTISISKAGISTTLNARCTVLAAANPILGYYKETYSPSHNIGLPESLLSRFDLIFIVLDRGDDERIADHILNKREDTHQLFLREYLKTAKEMKPTLTDRAGIAISKSFVELRQEKKLSVNVTPRMLETLIRLSTAIAKIKLSNFVEEEDALEAIKILRETLEFKVTKEIVQEKKEEEQNVDELISSVLYSYKENHPETNSISFDDFCKEVNDLNVSPAQIRSVLNYLHSIDVILFYDNTIFFL